MASTPDGIGCENLGFAPEDALGMENTEADNDEAENPVIFLCLTLKESLTSDYF